MASTSKISLVQVFQVVQVYSRGRLPTPIHARQPACIHYDCMHSDVRVDKIGRPLP